MTGDPRFDRTLATIRGRGASHRFDDPSFELLCWDAGDGPRIRLATLEDRLRDIVAVSTSSLGRVARAHPVPAIIKELTGKQGVEVLARARSVLGMLGKQALDPVPALVIDDRVMKAFMDLVLVGQQTDVDRVGQDLVEMPSADQPASGRLAPAVGSRFGSRTFSWSKAALSRTTLPISR